MHTLPPISYRVNRLIWAIIAAIAATDSVWMTQAGLQVDISNALLFLYVSAGCIAISLFYRFVRWDMRLSMLGQIATQLLWATCAIGLLSYLAARTNFPLVDFQLVAFDHDMGFDWWHYLQWMESQPKLSAWLCAVYFSAGPELLLIVALLFLADHIPHIQRLILAFIACALLTILMATLFPAVGGYVHYDIDLSRYHNIHPLPAVVDQKALLAMRAHKIQTLKFPLEGLVTFPSFHSTLALLLIYACRKLRHAWMVFVPLNLLVLVSTPINGGHYLIDILGGLFVAYIGIYAAERLLPRSVSIPRVQTSTVFARG